MTMTGKFINLVIFEILLNYKQIFLHKQCYDLF